MKAMANHRTLIFLCLLGVLICASDLYAEDTDCGDAPVTVSSEKAFATKAALGGLVQKLANPEASVDWKSKITSVIGQHPDADVKAINLGAWVIVCKTIRNSNIPDTEKVTLYLRAHRELTQATAAPGLKDAPAAQESRQPTASSSTSATQSRRERLTVATPVGNVEFIPVRPDEGREGWALRYLPSDVPDRNPKDQYFVVVKSAKSQAEGEAAIAKLRQKFPKYDFALYEPYQGNKSWGVMMAAWVTRADAEKVLKIAKSEVASDSYLWHF